MDAKELLKKVRTIEIKTRQISMQMFSGEYHSKFKGRGMTFSENREYYAGDDVRAINWNVTAKMNAPHTKIFEEERELNALVLVDVSASNMVGSALQSKKDLITEVAAVLAMSAIKNKDKVGVILFSDKVEKYIPPSSGKSHVLHIIRELIQYKPESKSTNISKALAFANRMVKKRSIFFLLSDFKDTNYTEELKRTKRKHHLTAIQISDKREFELTDVGFIKVKNPEDGSVNWLNTSRKSVRKKFAENAEEKQQLLTQTMKKSGVNFGKILTDESYIKPLQNLFTRA